MIKVFTVNKDGKICLTKEELQQLLDDSYWEGYRANTGTYVYTSPSTWKPWSITYCSDHVTPLSSSGITTSSNAVCSDSIQVSLNDFAEAYAKGEITNEI